MYTAVNCEELHQWFGLKNVSLTFYSTSVNVLKSLVSFIFKDLSTFEVFNRT